MNDFDHIMMLTLTKGSGQNYLVIFRPDQSVQAAEAITGMAADPRLDFDYWDASRLLARIPINNQRKDSR